VKTKWTFIAVVTLLMFAARPLAIAESKKAEQEVRELEDKVNAAYQANDLNLYFSFYAPDLSQWFPEGRTDLPSYRKQWTEFIQSGGRIEAVKISDLQIQVSPSGDAAVASYLLHVKTRSEKGQVTDEDNQETDVLFKRGGMWKIVFLHYSPATKKVE
jgi:ketosteroid isomerase-like protein